MSSKKCRWGILSTATIGRKNWQAIGRSKNAELIGVASRSLSNAESFIADNQSHFALPTTLLPRAFTSYEALLECSEIDAVYIPLPTGMRKQYVIAAAKQGKHVLCEKPCAVSAADLSEMLEACRQNKVQFMDGVMYMHSHRLQKFRSVIDDPSVVGRIQRIATQFSFNAPPDFFANNIRVDASLEPQGCLGDLGWYTIRFILWANRGKLPQRVRGTILKEVPSSSGGPSIPVEFSGELLFDEGVSGTFYNSFITGHQQWAVVSGSQGVVQINDFVLPYFGNTLEFESRNADFNPTGWDFNMEVIRQTYVNSEFGNGHETAQETQLFQKFSDLVLSGKREEYWPEMSLKTQIVLDAVLNSARNNANLVPVHTP